MFRSTGLLNKLTRLLATGLHVASRAVASGPQSTLKC